MKRLLFCCFVALTLCVAAQAQEPNYALAD